MVSRTTINVTETVQDAPVPWLIIIACVVIALLGLLIGMMWLRSRKARREHGHLEARIAQPETLADEQRDPGKTGL